MQRLFQVTPPLGARGPAYGGEYYTPTLRLALWHARKREIESERDAMSNCIMMQFDRHIACRGGGERETEIETRCRGTLPPGSLRQEGR